MKTGRRPRAHWLEYDAVQSTLPSVVPVHPPSNTEPSDPAPASASTPGRILFVGAGPGDPDLLTIRALESLRRAEVVVHDGLVPPAVIDAAGSRAERIPVPRSGSGDEDPGIAVGRLLVELARRHRLVVRLKGGDPTVFARLAEEQQPLREAGIAWEIVPGVTAALAAAALAGVPLTSRTAASSVTLLTGHEACDKESQLDFATLARLPGTLVIYMGVEQIATWSRSLIAAGKPADTPVVVVSRCAWPDQRICITTLDGCGGEFDRCRWPAPAIAIVGEVAGRHASVPAATGSLAGKVVLLTRPAGQGEDLTSLIAAHGGSAVHLPVIRIAAPDSWEPLDTALATADTFDWIVFASVHGVRAFCERLRLAGGDGRHLGTARIAAIGPATAREAALHGLHCDLVPDEHRSEGIVAALGGMVTRGRFLLVRANRGRDVMRRGLESLGHAVTEVAGYASLGLETLDPVTRSSIDNAGIDWITVTSSFIAESTIRLLGDRLRTWKVASLSPVTSATLHAAGIHPTVEAAQPTAAGLVEAIVGWETAHRGIAYAAESTEPVGLPGRPDAAPLQPGTAQRR